MIKIEEKSAKVLFAKGENGTIRVHAENNQIRFKPITDYVDLNCNEVPDNMVGDKEVILEFGRVESINTLIEGLELIKRNLERVSNPIPFAC